MKDTSLQTAEMIALLAALVVGAGMWRIFRGRVEKEGLIILIGRFIAGKPWHGKPITDAGYSRKGKLALTKTGHASWFWFQTGRRRMAIRITMSLLIVLSVLGLLYRRTETLTDLAVLAVIVLVIGSVWVWDAWGRRKHHRAWIVPLHQALSGEVGWPIAKPAKEWLLVAPDRSIVRVSLPVEFKGIQHELTRIDRIVSMRLALENPIANHQLRGASPHIIYTASKPPADLVPFESILSDIMAAPPETAVLGRGKKHQVVASSFALESPHWGVSMATGGGKSSLARLVLSQMLYKGCLVLILDWKLLSHIWALRCPNVWYAGEIEEIHAALCWLTAEITRRKRAAKKHAMEYGGRSGHVWTEDVVGPRLIVCGEELNATARLLRSHWHRTRLPNEEKYSPAIAGMEQGMFAGRELGVNVMGFGQMLSARAAMSGEARENMGTRILGWYTANNWKMMAPEHPMPPRSRHTGRVQVISGGDVTETQIGWIEDEDAHELALAGKVAQWPAIGATATATIAGNVPGAADVTVAGEVINPSQRLVSLADAVQKKIIPVSLSAARMRRHRDKEGFPGYRDQRGTELLYDPVELAAYFGKIRSRA